VQQVVSLAPSLADRRTHGGHTVVIVWCSGELLQRHWHAHHGTFCRGVKWEHFTLEELGEIVGCVGGLGLSVVCRLLAEDYAGATGAVHSDDARIPPHIL
jgi:hypothetical protein